MVGGMINSEILEDKISSSPKTMPVASICNGTVIDHILAGHALNIVHLLNLVTHHKIVTIGINLPSQSMGYKDIVKVEEWELKPDDINQIAIFAPQATISLIRDFQIFEKFKVNIPDHITSVIACPNPRCITNHDRIETFFYIKKWKQTIQLQCRFCRKTFTKIEVHKRKLL